MNDDLCVPCLKDVLNSFMPETFENVPTCVGIYNSNLYKMLSGSYKTLHWQPYFFFHIYDHLHIPYFADTFVLKLPIKC